jgi:hypothetical protein
LKGRAYPSLRRILIDDRDARRTRQARVASAGFPSFRSNDAVGLRSRNLPDASSSWRRKKIRSLNKVAHGLKRISGTGPPRFFRKMALPTGISRARVLGGSILTEGTRRSKRIRDSLRIGRSGRKLCDAMSVKLSFDGHDGVVEDQIDGEKEPGHFRRAARGLRGAPRQGSLPSN